MSLDRESIIRRRPLKLEKVHVPEWGGDVYVREMTGAERDWLDSQMYDPKTKDVSLLNVPNYRATIAALVLADENGALLFTKHDIPFLSSQPARGLERVMEAGLRVSGMSDTAVDDAEKNSEPGTSGSLGSD